MRETTFCVLFLMLTVAAMPMMSHDAEATRARTSTATVLEYMGSAQTVEVTGEWDDWAQPIAMVETDGVWQTSIELDEGLYCYKFIVDGTYIFDPTNHERSYCGDYENSLLRVRNHTRPSYSAELNGEELLVTYHPGSSGSAHDGTPSGLEGATWLANASAWAYDVSVLGDGKHTIHVEGRDLDGNIAYDLLIPFWRGPHSDFQWDDALIYMIMTDRFVNGNMSNDGATTGAAQGADWQGGDFSGVTSMINSGYFAELGVNALWLTPFNTAANGTGKAADGVHDVASFHGYWPVEAREVDPRLGTPEELEAMIDAAHDAGIRVMMDFVVNHVHEQHTYFQENPEWFNTGCICGQPNCDWTEHRLDCQFTSYMPDVNWKNRNASEQFIADALWWIETFDLDGARIDAVKHVENLAVSNLVSQINQRFETVGTDIYLKGETAMGWSGHSLEANQEQYAAINAYMGPEGLDGQADFVLYHAVVNNVFVSGQENYQHLDYWTNRSQDQYTPGSLMVPYVGSHDVPRLTSRADTGTNDANNQWVEDGLPGQPGDVSAYNAALQAYGWLLTTPGAPMMYYGDEYGEYGGADPDNRHMYRNNTSWSENEASLFENLSQLGQLRAESDALRRGTYSTRLAMANLLVYEMSHEDQSMAVVLNRGGPTTVAEFDADDIVRFGQGSLENSTLSVPAHSVTVIELNVSNEQNFTVYGCTDPSAINFNSEATVDDGTCQYPPPPVSGCTDSSATNFNSEATVDDGSCEYPPDPVVGCTDPNATNYDPLATVNDGCEYEPDPDANGTGTNQSSNSTGPVHNGTDNTNTTSNSTGNSTNSTNTNGSIDGNETNANATMQTCQGCCGNTFEVPSDEMCPMVSCEPCDKTALDEVSSATVVRNVLVGIIVVVGIFLLFGARRPPEELDTNIEQDTLHDENVS